MTTDVELRQLRYFVALAEELHFTRAAARLGISQPPLSQQIQRLEEILGVTLLVRRPRVKLTDAGEALLLVARKTLGQAEQGLEEVREAGRGEGGTLVIGFATSTLLGPLPALIRAYGKRFPKVRLVLRELSTAGQQKALEHRTIDVGLLREPVSGGTLTCHEVLSEPFTLALPPRHPLGKRSRIDLAEVAAEPFVHFPREVAPTLYDQVLQVCRRAGFTPLIAQEASEWLTIVGLVETGLGIALVPRSFERLGWGDVRYRPLRGIKTRTSVALCYEARAVSPQASHFIGLVTGATGKTRPPTS